MDFKHPLSPKTGIKGVTRICLPLPKLFFLENYQKHEFQKHVFFPQGYF